MLPKKLDDDLSVLPQIQPEEVAMMAGLGFKTLINNRPDGEEPQQPSTDSMAEAARSAGMNYVAQPVVSGAITLADVAEFREKLDGADKPALAYCRSGTRCTMLWALSQAGRLSTDEIISRASSAGYNLDGMRHQLEALAVAEQ